MMFDHNDSEGAIEEEALAYRRILRAFFATLLAGLGFALIIALFGCGPRATSAEVYAGAQQLCMRHPTHEERQACTRRVRAEWAPDGGAE